MASTTEAFTSNISLSPSVMAFTMPLHGLRRIHRDKRLVAGVAIVASARENRDLKKLLIIRRSSTEDAYPDMYEIPGGGAEDEDESILMTAARETKEETGLMITRILDVFEGFEYETRTGKAVQFNFLVQVEGGLDSEVKLNPSEHEAYDWIGVNTDLTDYPMTESMKLVVKSALKIIENTSAAV
ncbi:NUDIX hydrolase domain-like protein [Flammula alnicola]|nr:NUDIX hydrolase domain-like protein [Flammula alnicola]